MRPRGLWLVPLLFACSSPDTGAGDVSCAANGHCATGFTCLPDTKCHATGQTSSGNVAVVVNGFGAPMAGALVLFAGPDGAEIATGVTGDDGSAHHDLPAGGSVSVAYPDLAQLTTYVGVQPGDELHVGLDLGTSTIVGSAQVTPPGEFTGASSYSLELACAPAATFDPLGGEQAFDLTSGCLGSDGKLALLAHADDDQGRPIAFSGARGLDPTQPVALPAWSAAQPMKIQLVHPQSWAASYEVQVGFVVGDLGLGDWTFGASSDTVGNPLMAAMPAAGLVDHLSFVVSVDGADPASGLSPTSGLLYVGGAPAATVSVDLDQIPPHLTKVEVAGTPARPQITWTTDRAYPQAVAALVSLSWTDGTVAHGWSLVGAAASPFTAPPLPASFAALTPQAGVKDLAVDGLILEDIDDATTYAAWLAKHHGELLDVMTRPVAGVRVGLVLATR